VESATPQATDFPDLVASPSPQSHSDQIHRPLTGESTTGTAVEMVRAVIAPLSPDSEDETAKHAKHAKIELLTIYASHKTGQGGSFVNPDSFAEFAFFAVPISAFGLRTPGSILIERLGTS
jgi:hypothetical protein